MIKKIEKIKNLGIYQNYQWNINLNDFKRYNLFYGWNGTGKTTLSQLFDSFSSGISSEYPNLEYKFQTDDGDYTNNKRYHIPIRVFNRDYINANIDISSGKTNPINIILGEANKTLVEQIKQDQLLLNGDPEKEEDLGLIKELNLKENELEKKMVEKGKNFSDIAKIISTNTSGVSARNYRKNNAEQAFLKLSKKQILSNEVIESHNLTLKQQEKIKLDEINIKNISKVIETAYNEADVLMQKTVETVIIERLRDNPDISIWVEQGVTLHSNIESKNCEFCNQSLPEKRITQLLSYFNDADKKLKDDIDKSLNNISNIILSLENKSIQDKANLYDELQEEYIQKSKELKNNIKELIEGLSKLKDELEKKKTSTTVVLSLQKKPDTSLIIKSVKDINSVIKSHNQKSTNFIEAKSNASDQLEKHYLSEIYDDVKKLDEEIKTLEENINLLKKGSSDDSNILGIESLQERVKGNKAKISTSVAASNELNEKLTSFLGRDEISFEVTEDGYHIIRNEKVAKNLSEGEKTAIAFVYFTIHLQDQDFDLNNGIVVIDDPICSLDSNSIFQAFAFLKNTVKHAKQVFLFTHNYDFLRLLLRWLNNIKNRSNSRFFMIKNNYKSEKRVALIDHLDNLLKQYESEYQYLFNLLYNFKSDGTISSVYHIPNIARKVLENFLMIMIPNSQNTYTKLEEIEFDENKKTAIYKFTNDQSHITGKGFDPSLIPECQNNVTYLLEMIEKTFPSHYNVIIKSIGCRD